MKESVKEALALIGKKIAAMLMEDRSDFILPADKVAIVGVNNSLYHALLVLTNAGYTVIPALDEESRVKGLVSLPEIIRAVTGLESFDFERLSDLTVKEIMNTDFPILQEDFELEIVLHLLVRHPFICVADEEGVLTGIITRSELLKGTNRVAHVFESMYAVAEKEEKKEDSVNK